MKNKTTCGKRKEGNSLIAQQLSISQGLLVYPVMLTARGRCRQIIKRIWSLLLVRLLKDKRQDEDTILCS